ncbi:nuclear factor of activated T-cells 5 [Rhagoletis pomonella]|uniref:nuclear factor of activated T-cells 5 n=1 Tax=Rhagoletis pomonella TaxID=28610 RepID=UPI0017823AAF|nr:nuclear factor of activated T-cells 5 [Rhagoletis pomonella]
MLTKLPLPAVIGVFLLTATIAVTTVTATTITTTTAATTARVNSINGATTSLEKVTGVTRSANGSGSGNGNGSRNTSTSTSVKDVPVAVLEAKKSNPENVAELVGGRPAETTTSLLPLQPPLNLTSTTTSVFLTPTSGSTATKHQLPNSTLPQQTQQSRPQSQSRSTQPSARNNSTQQGSARRSTQVRTLRKSNSNAEEANVVKNDSNTLQHDSTKKARPHISQLTPAPVVEIQIEEDPRRDVESPGHLLESAGYIQFDVNDEDGSVSAATTPTRATRMDTVNEVLSNLFPNGFTDIFRFSYASEQPTPAHAVATDSEEPPKHTTTTAPTLETKLTPAPSSSTTTTTTTTTAASNTPQPRGSREPRAQTLVSYQTSVSKQYRRKSRPGHTEIVVEKLDLLPRGTSSTGSGEFSDGSNLITKDDLLRINRAAAEAPVLPSLLMNPSPKQDNKTATVEQSPNRQAPIIILNDDDSGDMEGISAEDNLIAESQNVGQRLYQRLPVDDKPHGRKEGGLRDRAAPESEVSIQIVHGESPYLTASINGRPIFVPEQQQSEPQESDGEVATSLRASEAVPPAQQLDTFQEHAEQSFRHLNLVHEAPSRKFLRNFNPVLSAGAGTSTPRGTFHYEAHALQPSYYVRAAEVPASKQEGQAPEQGQKSGGISGKIPGQAEPSTVAADPPQSPRLPLQHYDKDAAQLRYLKEQQFLQQQQQILQQKQQFLLQQQQHEQQRQQHERLIQQQEELQRQEKQRQQYEQRQQQQQQQQQRQASQTHQQQQQELQQFHKQLQQQYEQQQPPLQQQYALFQQHPPPHEYKQEREQQQQEHYTKQRQQQQREEKERARQEQQRYEEQIRQQQQQAERVKQQQVQQQQRVEAQIQQQQLQKQHEQQQQQRVEAQKQHEQQQQQQQKQQRQQNQQTQQQHYSSPSKPLEPASKSHAQAASDSEPASASLQHRTYQHPLDAAHQQSAPATPTPHSVVFVTLHTSATKASQPAFAQHSPYEYVSEAAGSVTQSQQPHSAPPTPAAITKRPHGGYTFVEVQKSVNIHNKLITERDGKLVEAHETIYPLPQYVTQQPQVTKVQQVAKPAPAPQPQPQLQPQPQPQSQPQQHQPPAHAHQPAASHAEVPPSHYPLQYAQQLAVLEEGVHPNDYYFVSKDYASLSANPINVQHIDELEQQEEASSYSHLEANPQQQYVQYVSHYVQQPAEQPVEQPQHARAQPSEQVIQQVATETHEEHHQPAAEMDIVEKAVEHQVEKIVERPVHIPYPVHVQQYIDRPYPVQEIVETHIPVPYPVPEPVPVPVHVDRYIDRPYPVEKIVEKRVPYPVEKVVEKIVEKEIPIEVEKIVEKVVDRPVPVPIRVPVAVPVPYAHQPLPVEYDEQAEIFGNSPYHAHPNALGWNEATSFADFGGRAPMVQQIPPKVLQNYYTRMLKKLLPKVLPQRGAAPALATTATTAAYTHTQARPKAPAASSTTTTASFKSPKSQKANTASGTSAKQHTFKIGDMRFDLKPPPPPPTGPEWSKGARYIYNTLPHDLSVADSSAAEQLTDTYAGPYVPLNEPYDEFQRWRNGHSLKRSPQFGRNLQMEYGFKPPLVPSVEINDQGIPLHAEEKKAE